MSYEEHVSITKLEAGDTSGDTGPDGSRPPALPDKIVEPRCGDIVRFNHLDDRPHFRVVTTSRPEDSDNSYGFNELGGSRSLNLSEPELVELYETDKSGRWPEVFARVDLFKRRRDTGTGGITAPDLDQTPGVSKTEIRHALEGHELPHDTVRCDECGVELTEADLVTIAADSTDESWLVTRAWCAGCAPERPADVDESVLAEGAVGLQSDPRDRRHYPVPVGLAVLNGHRGVPER